MYKHASSGEVAATNNRQKNLKADANSEHGELDRGNFNLTKSNYEKKNQALLTFTRFSNGIECAENAAVEKQSSSSSSSRSRSSSFQGCTIEDDVVYSHTYNDEKENENDGENYNNGVVKNYGESEIDIEIENENDGENDSENDGEEGNENDGEDENEKDGENMNDGKYDGENENDNDCENGNENDGEDENETDSENENDGVCENENDGWGVSESTGKGESGDEDVEVAETTARYRIKHNIPDNVSTIRLTAPLSIIDKRNLGPSRNLIRPTPTRGKRPLDEATAVATRPLSTKIDPSVRLMANLKKKREESEKMPESCIDKERRQSRAKIQQRQLDRSRGKESLLQSPKISSNRENKKY
jgi:hypothetical protein